MNAVLPALTGIEWDVVADRVGFSAEASAQRVLTLSEAAAVVEITRTMRPVVRRDGDRQLRGSATVDEGVLWIYVHAMGPGPCDEQIAGLARDLVADLWHSIHMAAAHP